MKREKVERWILLRQSGELGAWRTRRLERLLARDPALRAFAHDAEHLTLAARAWSTALPQPHTAEAIHARLNAPPERSEEWIFQPARSRGWWPAWAGVAAVLLLGGVLWLRQPAEHTTVSRAAEIDLVEEVWVDEELNALHTLLAWSNGENPSRTTVEDEEELLIRELLALEGLTI